MQKILHYRWSMLWTRSLITKSLLVMKLTIILITVVFLNVSANSIAQTINFSGKRVPLEKVFTEVKQQTDFVFMYADSILKDTKPITVNAINISVDQFLKTILKNQNLEYTIKGKSVFISLKPLLVKEKKSSYSWENIFQPIKGIVKSTNGEPIIGASVRISKLASGGAFTDANGAFNINANPDQVLEISYVGYKKMSIPVNDLLALLPNKDIKLNGGVIKKTTAGILEITLTEEIKDMDEVVISTGMFRRNKESFTGAVTSFNTEQILRAGNGNVLQSLKNLDPTFNVMDNIQFGANPNRLPDIEMLGQTSLSSTELRNVYGGNPNSPLFILDGFESDLQTISDLNINRIASITLLKDAASTALYGSRAANGVVVVETLQPKGGKLAVNYNTALTTETPYLNDYNLMNAAEKLEFERRAGVYPKVGTLYGYEVYTSAYYDRLEQVERGVDTYWLNEPLRNTFSQNHNLNVSGGGDNFIVDAGMSYNKLNGIMKESGRDSWRGSLSVTYRKNKININNQILINGYTSKESPYGNFSNFARANPYFEKRNPDGSIPRYLTLVDGVNTYPNPLYVASLNNIDKGNSRTITNNLRANYDINNYLRLSAGLSVNLTTSTHILFVPPDHPDYDNTIFSKKGSYTNIQYQQNGFTGYAAVTYARVFAEKHSVTLNARAEASENKSNLVGFNVIGFPLGGSASPNPGQAFGYAPGSTPSQSIGFFRRNNIIVSANYTLSQKYVIDANIRYDGSTAVGSQKKYTPFWSTGVAWNLHNESFIKNIEAINTLRLRGNIGSTGNQGLGQVLSENTFNLLNDHSIFGEMLSLSNLGSPNLDWQKTIQTTIGADFSLLDNRLSGWVNFFNKDTDPLIVPLDVAPSAGVPNTYINVGRVNYKGLEASVSFSPIYKPKDDVVWTVTASGSKVKGKYSGFADALNFLNQKERLNISSFRRYLDGGSPDDLWAVRSGGIDPNSGNELFIKKRSNLTTFDYTTADEEVIGSSRPTLRGNINNTINYKGFTLSLYCSYTYGADIINNALFNKVENYGSRYDIASQNYDRRGLVGHWQNPGDVVPFGPLYADIYATTNPPSSRYLQRQNVFRADNISIGYRWRDQSWLKRYGIQGLSVQAYTANLFTISSIKTERGIDYPFSKSYSLNIGVSF